MTRVTLIRHGEPEPSVLGTHYGQLDVALSEAGREQSEAVADRLASTRFDAVWSSDLTRAVFLATRLAASRGLTVQLCPALRERSVGVFQGLTYAEADVAYPAAAECLRLDVPGAAAPRGESMQDLAARVVPAVYSIVAEHSGQSVVIAGHGGPIRALLGHVLGVPDDRLTRIKVDYCGMSVIEFDADRVPRVCCVNGTCL